MIEVSAAIEEFRRGKPLIIVDDEGRENEGDVCFPADVVTPDLINFMAVHARGLICVAMTGARLDKLGLPLMTARNTAPLSTAFTVSVEAAEGVTTGISAGDRARTVEVLVDPESGPEDLTQPGHMFPLRARDGGVLVRAGQTEASVDLAKLAGRYPAAVICEIMREDGTMARMPDLIEFGREHDMSIVTVNDLIAYRLRMDSLIERVAESALPTAYGEFRAVTYRTLIDAKEHQAFVMGTWTPRTPPRPRHDQCVTGDVSARCAATAREQLEEAIPPRRQRGCGVDRRYMDQEGPRDGSNKIRLPPEDSASIPSRRTRRSACRRRPEYESVCDPRRPRREQAAPDDQQPDEALRPRGLRPRDCRARADRGRAERAQRGVPADEAREDGPHAGIGRPGLAWPTTRAVSTGRICGSRWWSRASTRS